MAARRGDRARARARGRRAKPLDEVERAAAHLYALPLEEFVKARDARSQELKRADKREEAERVRRLRKPTLAAWAVNQLARRRELDVRRLLKAGERLQEGQTDEEDSFLEARREESAVLRRLLRGARELLESQGHTPSDAVIEKVAAILRSAAVDEGGRELLAQGRVTQELEPGGFELFSALLGSVRPARRRGARPSGKDRATQRRRTREAERKAAEAAAEAEALERELVTEEQAVTDAERTLRDAERRAKALRQKVKRAQERAERARSRAESVKDS